MVTSLSPTPPLPADEVLIFLLQLGLLLALALALGRLCLCFGMPAVVGELLTGVLLGPSVLGLASPGLAAWLVPAKPEQTHLLDAVGLVAVLLLVGITGAHLDMRMVRRRTGTVLRVSLGGLVVPLALGVAAGFWVPQALLSGRSDRVTFSVFLGVAMCVSAIPVIAKTLSDMHLLHRDVGQLTLASAAAADSVGWFLLSLVSAMALNGIDPSKIAVSAAYLIGFVLLAVLLGRPLVRRLMGLAARSGDSGPSIAMAVIVILAGSVASHALGLEAVFGAFVMGILIGSPGVVDPARLAPLRTVVLSVLAPVFLATAGLRIDLTALADPVILLTGVVILLLAVLGKLLGAYAGARMSRLSHWEGLAIGAGLNARGVVEIVVAMVGLRLGVLSTATYTIVVLVAVFTSLMAPPLLRWAVRRIENSAEERLREAELAAWVVPVFSQSRS